VTWPTVKIIGPLGIIIIIIQQTASFLDLSADNGEKRKGMPLS